ncbi:hypothetical protein FE36_10370 [Xanthomonas oryzae pv. oryzicola]|nr:hypothetical protein FE36_10370 [Xanthomonas oryzae pv. oryzicola]
MPVRGLSHRARLAKLGRIVQSAVLRLESPARSTYGPGRHSTYDIELGAPGVVAFKGGQQVLTGPQGASMSPVTPSASHKLCEYTARAADFAGAGTMGAA